MGWKYVLVLQFPCSGQKDYDTVIAIEDALISQSGKSALVDGHDTGTAEMNIFIHTDNPQALLDTILDSHSAAPIFSHMKAAFREFESDKFTVLWPKGFKGVFTIT